MACGNRVAVQRYIALVVGCLAKFTNGAFFAFNVYLNAIKATFGYDQTQVETIASMIGLGISLGIFSGTFYDHFGPTWTSAVALVVTSGGYLLIYSAFFSLEFYSKHSGLLTMYYFITGFGASFTYMAPMLTNAKNFPAKHRAKVVSLLDTMFGCSPALYSLIYSYCFAKGHFSDPQNQDVAGFMLMFAISYAVSNLLCVIFLREFPIEEDDTEDVITRSGNSGDSRAMDSYNSIETHSGQGEQNVFSIATGISGEERPLFNPETSLNEDNAESINNGNTSKRRPLTLASLQEYFWASIKVFITLDYQLLFWTFCLSVSICGMIYNNIVVLLKSAELEQHQTLFTVVIATVGVPVRAFFAPLSDYLKRRVPRTCLFVLAGFINVLCHTLCIFLVDSFAVLLVVAVLTGVVLAMNWMMAPTVVSEMFGVKHMGRNWGIFLLCQAVLVLFVQWIFGTVFDNNSIPGTKECIGIDCFRTSFIITTCISVVPLVTSVVLTLRIENRL